MKNISRLLIAYDGSDCSDAMLQDLRWAGLPAALEAVVATMAYVFVPPDNEVNETISGPAAAGRGSCQTEFPRMVRQGRG
ncbi:MAG: hypothetical protein WAM70_08855 [Pyrinomonadaceae bacterium]